MAAEARFRGIFTPLVTPIDSDEQPDLASLARLVAFQIERGVHGLWAMGTSAEFASFDANERAAAVDCIARMAAGRAPVIANISDASTRLAIRHARHAQAAGVDALAATPPYYYPHSQDELLSHYRAIREAVDLPLFIYNIPQTVRVRVELGTARTLASEGTVRGVKDSQNDLEWFRQLAVFTKSRDIDFALFAGTRFLIDVAMHAGASGAIPSIANSFPELCVEAYEATVVGELERAARAEGRIMDIEFLTGQLPLGSRNAAVLGLNKAILAERGVIGLPILASPLRTPTDEERQKLLAEVARLAPQMASA